MSKDIKYILFDVAGTLLHKPAFYTTLLPILNKYGYKITLPELKLKHKIASELLRFPDRTSKQFYSTFNEDLLFALGIVPNDEILEEIFSACSYLPWEKFDDTKILTDIDLPIGIISNFNTTLKEKLTGFFGPVFKDILVSEELGIAKPEIAFYKKAIEQIGLPPQNILYVGDSLKLDIRPALQAGLKPLLIDRDKFFPASPYAINDLNQILNYIL
jgi:putative hydrolase of the HAD superfamily